MNIDELCECIRKAAEDIKEVNYENIVEFDYDPEVRVYRMHNYPYAETDKATDFAHEMIVKYNIPYFDSPLAHFPNYDIFKRVLKAMSMDELIKALDEYAYIMEDWKDNELAGAEHLATEHMPKDCGFFAVVYEYWYGCQSFAGHSFVKYVYCPLTAKTEEEFKEELDEAGIHYDAIISSEELKEDLLDDFKYREKLGEDCWGIPYTKYIWV